MKIILKTVLAAATIAGATALAPTLASAQVGISIGIGGPGPLIGGGYNPYEGDYYYDPIFFGGSWYHGPYRWRMSGGERVFWINGGWHRNEWRGRAYPASINFRNGGDYRGGRYEGFGDADRVNARLRTTNASMRGGRPDAASERGNMNQDRGSMGQDRGQMGQDRGSSMGQDRPDNGGDRQDGPRGDSSHNGGDGPHN